MSRYIDADKLIEQAYKHYGVALDNMLFAAFVTDYAPTEDVQPVVHAHWIPTKCDSPYLVSYRCSKCNKEVYVMNPNCLQKEYPYCNCGAKMDEVVNDG